MYLVNEDMSIYVTRGDAMAFTVTAQDLDGNPHQFKAGNAIRFTVVEKKACENVMLQKTFGIEENTTAVEIALTEADTRIGEVISKPTDYWYEVELNPFTDPQTIIGYDKDGARVFKLFPEGAEVEETPVEPEDIPVVDKELNAGSTRPVENQAITRAFLSVKAEADTAVAIAKGKNQAHVFDTTADMEAWLSDSANVGQCGIGDNLYIKEVNVPDWWISEVLTEADAETGFYYKVAILETQKADLTDVVKVYYGTAEPSADLGKDGDLYFQYEEGE